jgi:hypothetical protein
MTIAIAVLATLLLAAAEAGAVPARFEVTTNPYTFGQAPDWMPDGEHVVHHADRGEGNQIYVAKLDGTDERCLTCGQPGPNMVPDSRPQGDVILFHSWRGTNITLGAPGFGGLGSDLYVVPAQGGDAVALTADHDGYDNYHDGVRMQLPPDPARDLGELAEMLEDPPLPDASPGAVGLTPSSLLVRRTEIGRYVHRPPRGR